MTSPAPRRNRVCKRAVVHRTERITPHMIRVVLTSEDFVDNGTTDHYVKLLFGKPGVEYPEPLDMGVVRETFPAEHWPTMRTYTVRSWDEDSKELTIDFVYHGDEGVAGPWAAAAKAGDVLWFNGPGGAYAPDEAADWHLLVGDESALPAIGAAVEQLPPGARATVLLEVEDETEEQKFGGSGEVDVTFFHRAAATPPVATVWSPQSRPSTSPPATRTSSSTAKPASSSASARTSSPTAASPATASPSPATGASARTRTAGRPRRRRPPARSEKPPPPDGQRPRMEKVLLMPNWKRPQAAK